MAALWRYQCVDLADAYLVWEHSPRVVTRGVVSKGAAGLLDISGIIAERRPEQGNIVLALADLPAPHHQGLHVLASLGRLILRPAFMTLVKGG
ncbi:hypothetical protein [Bosea sp. NBC_00550]|uniref:hypothetical protein n=1 Tax=Bosea sp. NBC_00550 TaxID=2969621 RepID=UPI00222FE9A8|nr:hypothetical protein [Bosea sp. NBC_00550]UZF93788.1 hypothetical protein NWE53_06230 [Bosea sp. NBC_00550]